MRMVAHPLGGSTTGITFLTVVRNSLPSSLKHTFCLPLPDEFFYKPWQIYTSFSIASHFKSSSKNPDLPIPLNRHKKKSYSSLPRNSIRSPTKPDTKVLHNLHPSRKISHNLDKLGHLSCESQTQSFFFPFSMHLDVLRPLPAFAQAGTRGDGDN